MRGRGLMLVAGMKMGQAQAAQAAQLKEQGAEEAKAQAAAAAPPTDVNAELQKLADLHKQGILTDEEFSAMKKKLLGI
jgi:membrane protease subunit (stomatin/prohibitin family)